MASENPLRITWTLAASRAREEAEAVKSADGVVESEQEIQPSDQQRDTSAHAAFEPLTVLICSVAASFLAERLSRFIKSLTHGGLVVDLRTEPITVREERALDFGVVYVVTNEGLKQISKPDSQDILALIKATPGH